MPGKIERTIDELYQNDPERADAAVFGRKTGPSRRGFLGGSGLAAMTAAVGGAIPFAANMPGGLIPAALAEDLLDLAPLVVRATDRPDLFADPVAISPLARPSDQLVAYLGRSPLSLDRPLG